MKHEQAEARRARSKFLADLSSVELFGGVAKLARQCLPHMRDVLSDGAELERTLGATVAASDALIAQRFRSLGLTASTAAYVVVAWHVAWHGAAAGVAWVARLVSGRRTQNSIWATKSPQVGSPP